MKKKTIITLVVCLVLAVSAVAGLIIYDRSQIVKPKEITVKEAEELIYEQVNGTLSNGLTVPLAYDLCKQLKIQANSLEYGNRTISVYCTYQTSNIFETYLSIKDQIFETAYVTFEKNKNASSTAILVALAKYKKTFSEAPKISGEITVTIYQPGEDLFVGFDDETVNTLLGGVLSMKEDAKNTTDITVKGESVDISRNNTLRKGVTELIGLANYDSKVPDVSTPLVKKWNELKDEFYRNFIEKDRWTYLASGLLTTLEITGLALILGTVLGFITAIIRCTHDKEGKLGFLNKLASLYVTIIRGTPVMVQLLIIYFVILLPIGIEKFTAAVLCFGFNSGAYVCEIIRGGIMSVDNGQFEAGRSLGFNYIQTMAYIIIPQAFKAVLPALCNEFIALLKETSVAFYIGVADLTRGGIKIRSLTYSNFMPLIAIALIYLILVLILTKLVSILERRLRRSER